MSFLSCFAPKPKDRDEEQAPAAKAAAADGDRPAVPPLANGLNGAAPADDKPVAELDGFDTARETAPAPPVTAVAQIAKPKGKGGHGAKKADPAARLVKELPKHPEYRRQVVELVKASGDDEGLPAHIIAYLNDHGHSVPSLAALNQALADVRGNDLLLWASRYNLFVQWSADRQHPWDALEQAERLAAVLEIGKAEFDDEPVVLLDGVPVREWSFKNSVFTTREPVEWTTPLGDTVAVDLSLKFGAFFGYTRPGGDEFAEVGSQSYLGTQAHGVMWPAAADLPHGWPVAPPIVAGKVNIASAKASLSPGATDPIGRFAGVYSTHYLPNGAEGKALRAGPELSVSVAGGSPVVSLNGAKVEAWAFSPNNVLSWEDGGGHTAWLLFMPLAGGAVIMGNVLKPDQDPPSGFSIFGELKEQPSRVAPTARMDAVVGHRVAAGLQVASTLLLGEILDLVQKLWAPSGGKFGGGSSQGQAGHASDPPPEALLAHKVDTLLQLEDLGDLFSRAFLDAGVAGGVEISNVVIPGLVDDAAGFRGQAEAKTEAAKAAAVAAERDARETEEADKTKAVATATYKAAQAAVHAQEAAEAAADAERLANESGEAAQRAATTAALDHALAAAQAFNLARGEALVAAKAERRAAAAALSCVEAGIEVHARAKNFDKLRETAQASGIATKVLSLASQAVEGWEANTAASRLAALQAAKAAAAEAQECNKHTRRMQPVVDVA